MATKKLKLIPAAKIDPKKMTILQQTPDSTEPLIATEGKTDPEHACGACGKTLMTGAEPGSIRGIVFRCSCGAYNDATI
jgi:hypothetical protein